MCHNVDSLFINDMLQREKSMLWNTREYCRHSFSTTEYDTASAHTAMTTKSGSRRNSLGL